MEKKKTWERVDLTIGFINNIKPTDKRIFFADLNMTSLVLKVEPTGHKSWFYSYRAKGRKPRQINLGPVTKISPANARAQVKRIAADLLLGKDPYEERDNLKTELTVKEALTNWSNNSLTVSNGYRKSTIKTIRNSLNNWIFKRSNNPDVRRRYSGLLDIQNKKISFITSEDIKKIHRHVGAESPIAANRLIEYLRMAFNSFLKNKPNPCKILKREKYEESTYNDYLDNIEFERVLNNLFVIDSRNGLLRRSYYEDKKLNPVACCLMAFQLVTGRRTRSEASSLKWSEVREDRIILQETKTSKHGTQQTFYLSDKAKEILQVIRRERMQKYLPGIENKNWFRNRFAFPVDDVRNKFVFPSREFGKLVAVGKECKTPYQVDVRATWKKILLMSGVERWLKPYATRHSLASFILNNGGNINQVMKVLGVSLATAMRYAKLVPGSELDILNKIGQKKETPGLVQVK